MKTIAKIYSQANGLYCLLPKELTHFTLNPFADYVTLDHIFDECHDFMTVKFIVIEESGNFDAYVKRRGRVSVNPLGEIGVSGEYWSMTFTDEGYTRRRDDLLVPERYGDLCMAIRNLKIKEY
jgi:hypothetical protein